MNFQKFTPLALTIGALICASSVMASEAKFEHFSYQGKAEVKAESGQYTNPIIPGYYPDPSITRVGDDYYLTNSSFAYFPGLPIFHSKDLVNWQQIGNAFDRHQQFDLTNAMSSRGIFAPAISYHDGLFYLVSTCVECNGPFFNNFVMTAKDPAGPWSDPVSLGFAGIDPSIFWDDNGKAYILHNDDPIGGSQYDGHKAIWMQEFDPETLSMVGERVQVINGGSDLAHKPFWIEGPHIFKKDDFYYLIAAEGGTQENHSEVVFRARDVKGPYQSYPHNPILTQRTLTNPTVANIGHADIVQAADGSWWSVFLGVRPYDNAGNFNTGRETFLLPVEWKDGWPVILQQGKSVPLVHDVPFAGEASVNGSAITYEENFEGKALDMRWISLRNPQDNAYQLQDGALILHSDGKLGEQNQVPAFVGIRQQNLAATITTSLQFSPDTNGEQAGLVAIQSDQSLLFFGIGQQDGQPVVMVSSRANSEQDVVAKMAPVSSDSVELTMAIENGRMTFSYSVDGKPQTLLKDFDTRFLSTTQAGGFVGTVIGPYYFKP